MIILYGQLVSIVNGRRIDDNCSLIIDDEKVHSDIECKSQVINQWRRSIKLLCFWEVLQVTAIAIFVLKNLDVHVIILWVCNYSNYLLGTTGNEHHQISLSITIKTVISPPNLKCKSLSTSTICNTSKYYPFYFFPGIWIIPEIVQWPLKKY